MPISLSDQLLGKSFLADSLLLEAMSFWACLQQYQRQTRGRVADLGGRRGGRQLLMVDLERLNDWYGGALLLLGYRAAKGGAESG